MTKKLKSGRGAGRLFISATGLAPCLVLSCQLALAGEARAQAELHLRSDPSLSRFHDAGTGHGAGGESVARVAARMRSDTLGSPDSLRLALAPELAPAPQALMLALASPHVMPTLSLAAEPDRKDREDRTPGPVSAALPASGDDEILALLRASDQALAGETIALPDTTSTALDAQAEDVLSLEEALARTLQNSYSYAAVRAQARGARFAEKAALGQLGPALDVRAQRGREYSAPASTVDPNTGEATASSTHIRWDSSVVIRQPLFTPGSYFDYRKQASLAVATDMRKEDAREGLYYQAIKAYYDVVRAYAMRTFAQRYAGRMQTLQDYMHKRMQGGGASKVDFERVRGRALLARSSVIEAEGVLESAMVSLAQLTGVRPQKVEIPARMMPSVPPTAEQVLEDVAETSPSVRAARLDAEAASQELKSARSRFSPSFSLELTQARTSNAGGDGTLTTDRRYMLVMNMNLLNGGSDYYYQKEIGAKYVERSNTAADIERKLKEQVAINYRTLDAVKRRIEVARQAYETNAGVADVFLDQLTTGNKQLLDVLDAYQQAYQSHVELTSLLFLQADISYQVLRNTGRASTFVDTLQTP